MSKKQENIEKFLIYCTEIYKNKKGITGKQVIEKFQTNKVYQYLEKSYEVLHTQGNSYILSEIEEYIKNKK